MKSKANANFRSQPVQSRSRFVRAFFWLFAFVLIVLNVIPLGRADASLSSSKVSLLRLDYIVHATIMLGFAWIHLLARCLNTRIFASCEKLKFITFVILIALILELLQILVPWRSFNPFDLYANIIGAIIAAIVVWLS